MAYNDFTLETAGRLLGVVTRSADLFSSTHSVEPPVWLSETLKHGAQGTQLALISEKSRSAFVVAPILLAARELCGGRFSIYSGQRLDVDASRGLVGECDFILAANEGVFLLTAPIAIVVEAKKNDIESDLGQCVAQMVAASEFNQTPGVSAQRVFGCVTTGETWQFLELSGSDILLDRQRYYIDNVSGILGAFQTIATQDRRAA
jgi:hypothetical protein